MVVLGCTRSPEEREPEDHKRIQEAQQEARHVHFATLMDICHLTNAELEPQFQKYKGRVVLRGDMVKDDSGSHAVFTEQVSSGSQVTAVKVYTEYTSWSVHNTLLLVITRLRTPWLKIMLCLRRSHGRSHAHFHPVFDVVTQRQVCSFSVTALVSTSFPKRTRSWCNSPDAPARWSESGRMADSVPNTKSNGCKSKATRMAVSLVFNGTTFSVCSSVLHSSRLMMSLLNVPYRPFLRVLSSPSPPSSRPSASSTSIARSRCSSPSAPARWSESGRMADSGPNTGYEPKLANFSSYTDLGHTPTDIPDSQQEFLCPDDVTMIPTSPEGLRDSEAFSSSQKATASRVSSLLGHPGLGKLSAGHVSGRPGHQETGAELDKESVATTLVVYRREGKEIETPTLCIRSETEKQLPKDP